MGKFRPCLTEILAHDTIMAGYYSFFVFFLFYFVFKEIRLDSLCELFR